MANRIGFIVFVLLSEIHWESVKVFSFHLGQVTRYFLVPLAVLPAVFPPLLVVQFIDRAKLRLSYCASPTKAIEFVFAVAIFSARYCYKSTKQTFAICKRTNHYYTMRSKVVECYLLFPRFDSAATTAAWRGKAITKAEIYWRNLLWK